MTAITIQPDYAQKFSYARMQSGMPAVRSILLKNPSTSALKEVKLTVSFDPPLAEPFETVVSEIRSRGKFLLDQVPLLPSATFLANLTEPAAGKMTIRAEGSGLDPVTTGYPLQVLPYDHWEGLRGAAELLPCFVTPNHPALRPVLQRAAEKLGQWTGDPSLNEYQSGDDNRVKLQMAALYGALCEKQIVYATPPASFAAQGQRIRMAEDIFSGGFATCLDAALLYAGCLEAVGLRPLIVIHDGHAYAGAWLTDLSSSPYPVNDDPASLSKRIAPGIQEILLVETLGFLKGNKYGFDVATARAEEQLSDTDSFCCYVDVASARNMGILPLPLRVLTPEGYVIENPAPSFSRKPEPLSRVDEIELDAPVKVTRYAIWERKLLDLTLRNNLVNLHRRGLLQLVSAVPEAVVTALEEGRSLHVFGIPVGMMGFTVLVADTGLFGDISHLDDMVTYVSRELGDGRLHSYIPEPQTFVMLDDLRKSTRHTLEENGANTLYLTVGALRWMDENGRAHSAPILLIPVEITKATHSIRATGEDFTVNLTLLEMLRQQHDIRIPGLDPLPEKDGHIDFQKILNTFRRAIMDKKGWDVEDLTFLGNFTFNKFIIWNDVHTHRQMLADSPAVASLVAGKLQVPDVPAEGEGSIDNQCPAAEILQPLSADSSQLRAIRDAVAGRSFVLHGPPGTGKSQTITNIIANCLYRGKRVLFVSEKMAALEVVQRRLMSLGLDPFCLELHSNKSRKSAVLAKLDATLATARAKSPSAFTADAARMDENRQVLNGHAESLHRVYPAGCSLYDCLSRYLTFPTELAMRKIPLPVLEATTPARFSEYDAALSDYLTAIRHTAIGPDCRLLDLPLAEYTPAAQEQLVETMQTLLQKRGVSFWLGCRLIERMLGTKIGVRLNRQAMASVRAKLERWSGASEALRRYAIYSRQRGTLCGLGLAFLADAYESGAVPADLLEDFFHKSFYRSYAEYILGREKDENLFCGELFESAIRKFRQLDRSFGKTSRKALYASVVSRLPDAGSEAARGSEMAILKKAIRNNARGMSLRTLFDRIPTLLPQLCPCMLMSPLSVSQYLQPVAGQFDLVIFDEASQLPTSEAVASIARGKALIVVGDPRQLPPTTFFENNAFDEENAEKEDLESVLDEFIALSLPSSHLRWHYRSRHESLIAFSNANYYDNGLLTFPSNDDMATRVSFRRVEGVYDRGRSRTNGVEADAVVEEVRRRLSDPELAGHSIGIVTFNISQQNLIEKRIDEMLAKNRALAKVAAAQEEPLFVKSLENVQGDERDVILFSIGYGKDRQGRVSLNFGPVNQAGGWRRLNVAVSRAREEMMVFSTLQPEDIPADGYLARGVADLRAFLKYARDGRESLAAVQTRSIQEDLFVERLAEELRGQGLTVNTGIGSSDFRVDIGVVDPEHPERYLYGILCDGPVYASAEAARDREIIRPEVLQGLGWKLKRKWILDSYDH